MESAHRQPIQLRCLVVEPSPSPSPIVDGGEGLLGRRSMRWIEGVDRWSSLAPSLYLFARDSASAGDRFISTFTVTAS